MRSLDRLAWPLERLHEALTVLGRRAAPELSPVELEPPSADVARGGRTALQDWLEAASASLGVEVEEVAATASQLSSTLGEVAPALVLLPGSEEPRFLLLIGRGRRRVACLDPGLRRRFVSVEALAGRLRRPLEEELEPEVEPLVSGLGLSARKADRVSRALLEQRLAGRRLGGCWLLRQPPGAGFRQQVRQHRLPRLALRLVSAHAAQQLLLLASWAVLGMGALGGRIDPGWLVAWTLLLLSMTPFRALEIWTLARLTAAAGALLKRRLMAGALKLAPDEVRHEGIGHFLGRVIDSEAVESQVLSAGHLGLIAGVELVLSLPILVLGAGGWFHALLLAAWIGFSLALWWRFLEDRRQWTALRLGMTHDLVEKMVGHRTRLAQKPTSRLHEEDDAALEEYLETGRRIDRRGTLLLALVPRGWLVVGLLGLAPAFLSDRASVAGLAVGVGGLLFAYQALWKMVGGLFELAGALVAWDNVAPLFQAADRPRSEIAPELAASPALQAPPEQGTPVLAARDLSFRYQDRAEPVLEQCSLEVLPGERILLEGASGSGKSTLASLLTGLRQPRSGLLLLRGLDRQTLGDRTWRRRVVSAPQFHENWVLTETLAFNLLMGRAWPPGTGDLEEAEEVCRELGLGELLERMPSGLQQMVGESGWQLSHGEKSRLFIARALLQKADAVILDESFAALDPETFRLSLDCVLRRAPSLVLIAHP